MVGFLKRFSQSKTTEKGTPKQRVLFVCDWNAARSPLAETILNAECGDALEAASAGIEASDYIDSFIIALCKEKYDINLINKEPIGLAQRNDLASFDIYIALTKQAYSHLKTIKETQKLEADIEYWETSLPPDKNQPRDMIMAAYNALYDEIKSHIDNRFSAYL